MFYKTKIKETRAGYAIDIFGKHLTFASNYPCQAGDSVWTDGKIIFGSVSRKPQPVIFDQTPRGIPVIFYDEEGTLKKGYFDSRGNFKRYSIADDLWLVNDEKNFLHGEGDFLDVEISNDGKLLTAELDKNNSALRISNGEFKSDAVVLIKQDGKIFKQIALSNFVTGIIADESYGATCYWGFFKLDRAANWYATFNVEGFCQSSQRVQNIFGVSDRDDLPEELRAMAEGSIESISHVVLPTSFTYEESFAITGEGAMLFYSHLVSASGSSTPVMEYYKVIDGESTIWKTRNLPEIEVKPDTSAVSEVNSLYDFPVQDDIFISSGQLFDGDKMIFDFGGMGVYAATKINSSQYLLTIGDGLWKLKDGEIERLGYSCRNFRLRKLNNISLARR